MDGDQTGIQRVLAGDVEAFRELVERHQRRVFLFVRNIVRHMPDVEDLVQDVFAVAFQKLASFDAERSQFSTWLLTIARNRCLNHLQKLSLATSSELDLEARTIQPVDAMLSRELHARLDAALELLPLEQRTAFVLAEIDELPYSEIALIEEVELGTVKSRVSRAKQRLREELSDLDPKSPSSDHSKSEWALAPGRIPIRDLSGDSR